MEIGEIFEGRVRNVSSEGLGVVDAPDKRVFFVPATWIGDFGRFEVLELKKRHGFARIVELTEKSTERVDAPCWHHGWLEKSCGGCPWQFVNYPAQLAAKQDRVVQALHRARMELPLKEIVPSPKVFGYRNRAQLKTNGKYLGYVAAASRNLAPVLDCVVLSDKNRATLKQLVSELPKPEWKHVPPHPWNFVDIDEDIAREDIVLNKRRPFRQANTDQNNFMREWLAARLETLPKSLPVLELFAGSGNFTEVIAGSGFTQICAAEVIDAALDALREKKLPGVTCVAADLFENAAYKKLKQEFPVAEVLVLDPPRDGLKEKQGLLEAYPDLKAIASISCDVATFTRDLADFVAAGFKVIEVQPLDQFPHTPHIEIMAWLER